LQKKRFMPILHTDSYLSPTWLPNGHFQSIYPALFRKIKLTYQRERISTPDDDFLNLDWSMGSEQLAVGSEQLAEINPQTPNSNRAGSPAKTLVILSHGLEGDSSRQYITGMVRLLNAHGYDCLAWNFRSCGGEMNRQPRFYHSGEITDLDWVIRHAIAKGYAEIYLMGFSLGGNVTLKYLGEHGAQLLPVIKKAVVFSVPMDLSACSHNINKRENWVYAKRFLGTLKTKATAKGTTYPQHINVGKLGAVKTLWDFDHFYTGPLHGFGGAEDYYRRCSSKYVVQNIAIPTLIVNAKNDPLVPYESLPAAEIAQIPHVWLELTTQGGHCGFRPRVLADEGVYWSEQRALAFFQQA
jgi:uncharacterized protein